MTKKEWAAIGITTIIIVAGYWIDKNYYSPKTAESLSARETQQAAVSPIASAQAGGFYIGSAYVTIVTYDGSSFSPSTITIPKGSAVIFRNYSSKNLRVASNPHPSHDGYPTKNGCAGSTFDSCSDIPPKVSWSFFFDYTGQWGYHNHLNPSQSGTIIVK